MQQGVMIQFDLYFLLTWVETTSQSIVLFGWMIVVTSCERKKHLLQRMRWKFLSGLALVGTGIVCKKQTQCHRENGGTLGTVPLIFNLINPIYTLYSGHLMGISPFKGFL